MSSPSPEANPPNRGVRDFSAGVKVAAICTFPSSHRTGTAENDPAREGFRSSLFQVWNPIDQDTATMRTAALATISSVAFALLLTSTAQAEIPWEQNLRKAHAKAAAEGKLMLLHFYSDNCVYCERLEAGAFQEPQVSQAITKNFVPVKIHANSASELTKMFKVSKFPTDVVVTTEGKKISHKVSPQDPSKYVAMLVGTLPAAEPKVDGIVATSATSDQLQAPSTAGAPTAAGLTLPDSIGAQAVSAAPGSESKSQLAGFRNGNSFELPSDLEMNGQTPTAQTPAIQSPTIQTPTTKSAERQSPVARSAGEPELAMEGFCAVTVISEDKWVEGKPEFGVIHLGKLYLFENEAAMNTFLADPIPYTPVLNEIDVVRFFEERTIVPGKREWGVKDPSYQRMFFFADEAAMNHFIEEHHRYTDAAVEVMEKAVKDANPDS
jgi:protein disulfide-isomerase